MAGGTYYSWRFSNEPIGGGSELDYYRIPDTPCYGSASGNTFNVYRTSNNTILHTFTAVPREGYKLSYFSYNGSPVTGNITNPGDTEIKILAVFVKKSQSIVLDAGHDYIVMSEDVIASAEVSGNTLAICNEGPIDVIDLGAGSRSGGPSVMIADSERVGKAGSGFFRKGVTSAELLEILREYVGRDYQITILSINKDPNDKLG